MIEYHPDEVRAFRRVLHLHLDGWTQQETADRLNEDGTPVPFGRRRWNRAVVREALEAARSGPLDRAELAAWITAAGEASDGMQKALRILPREERSKAEQHLYAARLCLQRHAVELASDMGDGESLARLRPAQEDFCVWPTDAHPLPDLLPSVKLSAADQAWIDRRRGDAPSVPAATGKDLN